MFGIGYQEAFVILVIALVVFGPHRLPELAAQAGRWVREFKKITGDLTGEFEKTIAEVDDIKRTVQREMKGVMDEVDSVAGGVKKDLSGKPKTVAAKTPAKPGVNTGKILTRATKNDPLSDVSAMDDKLVLGPITKRVVIEPNGTIKSDAAIESVRKRRAAAAYSRH